MSDNFHSNAEKIKCEQNQRFIDSTLEGIKMNKLEELNKRIEELEAELKDAKKQLIDRFFETEASDKVIELFAENQRLVDAIKDAFNEAENCPELNMSNYDINQVTELNSSMILIFQILQKALEGK